MDDLTKMSKFEDEESVLGEEIEILESIYINELEVEKNDSGNVDCIRMQLHPATGENTEEQYVCLTLEFRPTQQYPEELPGIVIRNPRGLAEDHVNSLRNELQDLAEDRKGGHMLYDLIELAKESLTQSNIPHGPCAVCLESFTGSDAFTKTDCYHYFHTHCLLRHVEIAEREITAEKEARTKEKSREEVDEQVYCPVCRKTIQYDITALRSAPSPTSAQQEFRYRPDPTMRELQAKMAALFRAQKAKGGIIDPEEEKKKLLLSHAQQIVQASEEAEAKMHRSASTPQLETKQQKEGMQDGRPESGPNQFKPQSRSNRFAEDSRPKSGSNRFKDSRPDSGSRGWGRGNTQFKRKDFYEKKDRDENVGLNQQGPSQDVRKKDRYKEPPKENYKETKEKFPEKRDRGGTREKRYFRDYRDEKYTYRVQARDSKDLSPRENGHDCSTKETSSSNPKTSQLCSSRDSSQSTNLNGTSKESFAEEKVKSDRGYYGPRRGRGRGRQGRGGGPVRPPPGFSKPGPPPGFEASS